MTDLFEKSSQKLDAAITEIQHAIAIGMANKQRLFETMRQLYGEGSANGAWSQRDAFDLLEAALTRHMAGLLNKPQMMTQISEISALIEALPTHTVRSEDQIRYQQFSTPADLAALSVILAQPLATDIVLEPSAGHGALVATLPDVSALHLNEIDPRRREKLALLLPQATTTGIDGAMLASHLDAAVQPSLILMNPPFSRSMGRGADEFAAVRHLRAAITRLRQGGRIVAIMPDWFTTSAKLAKIYEDTFASCTVRTSIRLDKCYHKQGTSVAVRLYVIDKIPGQIRPAVLARQTVAGVASAVPIIKRVTVQPDCEPRAVPPKAKPGALFKAMRATPITKPVKARAAQAPKIEALAFSTLDKPRVLGEQSGVYIPYRPSRVDIAGAREHPTPLVESVAMGSIPAPIPDYVPALQDRVLQESLLSEAQIETVIYAGNAWQQYLPGLFIPAEEAAARSRFESTKQRFFNQLLLSMKLPTLIAAINLHLDRDEVVVVQLVSTAESILDRRLDSLSPEERAELDLDLSPLDAVIEYLERAFPTQQMQVFVDDTGTQRSAPMFDEEGRPVHNQTAIARRSEMIEHLCAMPPIKPALDGIIEHYGPERVAEVTGRSKRLITQSDGQQRLETRSPRTNQSETDQFMDGRKPILVFSDAGGTGRSYHASLDAACQKRRIHFLLEPGWRAAYGVLHFQLF